MIHTVRIPGSRGIKGELPAFEQGILDWFEVMQITDWDADYVRTYLLTDDFGTVIGKKGPHWTFSFGNPHDAMLFKLAFGGVM